MQKLNTKITILESLAKHCDTLIIGGGLGTAFALADGTYTWTDALYKPEYKPIIEKNYGNCKIQRLQNYNSSGQGCRVRIFLQTPCAQIRYYPIFPTMIVLWTMVQNPWKNTNKQSIVPKHFYGTEHWEWQNGGDVWGRSTFEIIKHIASRTRAGKLKSIVGGGDSVTAIEVTENTKDMSYISTGGGAFLEFIEGRKLPGIEALRA